MADEIPEELKAVNTIESVRPSKEYIDDKGEKIIVNDVELETVNLKAVSIGRLEVLGALKELQSKEACQNCRFWNAIENRTTKDGSMIAINGECRVNAPEMETRLYQFDSLIQTNFPLIGPFQWCGKYEKIA